ncbi:MAG: hypothetical protein ABSC90_09140 [Acidimicrobiales bacterium]
MTGHRPAPYERRPITEVGEAVSLDLFAEQLGGQSGLATVLSATMRGLVLMALSDPDIASHRAAARPFGASEVAEWSLPALGFASIASGFLEEDMGIEWNDDRVREVRETLDSMTAEAL